MNGKPRILIVGGPDVDKRLDLMHALQGEYELLAAGSGDLADRFLAAGFPFHRFPMRRTANPAADLATWASLHRLYRRLRPDIVHTFATKPTVWGRIAARTAGVPITIGTVPGLGSLFLTDRLSTRSIRSVYERLQAKACQVSDLTIFFNRRDADYYRSRGFVSQERSIVMPGSGVRTDLLDPALSTDADRADVRSELGVPEECVLVTMIGRILRTKGVMEFAEAAAHVGETRPNVRFLLIGPEDQHSLDRLDGAELDQLRQAVVWPGPRPDIVRLLAASDIFVLPSYREGIPRVLLEAASMGLPLVSTQAPGCEEVVSHGSNGFLVPIRSAERLAKAIMSLAEDPETRRRMGAASRRRAVTEFDIHVIAKTLDTHYRRLLHGLPGAGRRAGTPIERIC